jgi:hypothetical protein
MNRTLKIGLDIIMGAVIPILILRYLSEPLGTVTAYVTAALVPVGWVFIDLVFITRRFNFITSYVGLFAVVNGLLAFWFVDGLLYAFKDSIGFILTVSLFGGSLLIGRPFIKYFVIQGLNPDTSEREQALLHLLHEPPVYGAIVRGSLIIAGVNLLTGLTNFLLNLFIVTASFGTTLFNEQVATVNAITRLVLNIPEALGMGVAIWLSISRLYQQLSCTIDEGVTESELWELIERHAETSSQDSPDTRAVNPGSQPSSESLPG